MKFFTFLFSSLFIISHAAHSKDLSQALLDCADEKNSLKRLVCYDQLTKNYKQFDDAALPTNGSRVNPALSANTRTPQPTIGSAQSSTSTPENSEQEFGLPTRISKQEKERVVTYVVKKIQKGNSNRLVITMENGQVWEQSDTVTILLKEGDEVYVKRGALGSFFLSTDKTKKRIRVKRRK